MFHDWFQGVGFVDEPGGVPPDEQLRTRARHRAPGLADRALDDWLHRFHEALSKPGLRSLLQRAGARDLWLERAFALREDGRLL